MTKGAEEEEVALWKEAKPSVGFRGPKGEDAKGERLADGCSGLGRGGEIGRAPNVEANDVETPNPVDDPKGAADDFLEGAAVVGAGGVPNVNVAGADVTGAVVVVVVVEEPKKEPPPKVKGAPTDAAEEVDDMDDEAAKEVEKPSEDVSNPIEDEDAEDRVVPAAEAPKVKGANEEGADQPKSGVEEKEDDDKGRQNIEEDDSEVKETPVDTQKKTPRQR